MWPALKLLSVYRSREARRQSAADINLQACRVSNKLQTIRIRAICPPTSAAVYRETSHAISTIYHVNLKVFCFTSISRQFRIS